MFRKKGEFLGVYDYADEVYEVYPHPIEGAIIGVMNPYPSLKMYVKGRWVGIVGEKYEEPTPEPTPEPLTPGGDDSPSKDDEQGGLTPSTDPVGVGDNNTDSGNGSGLTPSSGGFQPIEGGDTRT